MKDVVTSIWHKGREWVSIAVAAEVSQMSEAAVYKAVRLEQLETAEILGVKAVPLDALRARWPQPEPVEVGA